MIIIRILKNTIFADEGRKSKRKLNKIWMVVKLRSQIMLSITVQLILKRLQQKRMYFKGNIYLTT